MRTAVVLLIFNRPDLTARVFERIAEARPPKLFVVADGPREGVAGEAERCLAARAAVESADWGCEVLRDYSEVNLGCKRRVSSGLEWVFGQVEEAVVLEDDCLPSLSFFRFCDELLERYRDDERVMMISGNNFRRGAGHNQQGYYFSRNPHVWGWATWRRAWRLFDVSMSRWPELRAKRLVEDVLGSGDAARSTRRLFDETFDGRINTWDYQWLFTLWSQHGLAAVPAVNLVSNLGFRADATHTHNPADERANLPARDLSFPLRHPPCMTPEKVFADSPTEGRLLSRLARLRFNSRA